MAGSMGDHDYSARYLSHPWDNYGQPPPLSNSYEPDNDAFIKRIIAAAALMRDADEKREQADEIESEAEGLEDEAVQKIASLQYWYPGLINAVREDPWALIDEESVREYLRD